LLLRIGTINAVPEQHPGFDVREEALGAFLQRPEIYALIHQTYISTVLVNDWVRVLQRNTETILAEIDRSLNN